MKKYEKWRELEIDPINIKYKNIEIKSIDSYLPAGNDVVECSCILNGKTETVFIKIARSKMADFETEVNNITLLNKHNLYSKLPLIVEDGYVNNKKYIVLKKIVGDRLSDILEKSQILKKEYLIEYGKELSLIHRIPVEEFTDAKQRPINEYPQKRMYPEFDSSIMPYIEYLKKYEPIKEKTTFIHGDFHYANILWQKGNIVGVIDWEYSGVGFKEQDIAWACILRSTQRFMDTIEDIKTFLIGYSINGTYNKSDLKWCLINGMCHFYLMNKENEVYKNKLIQLMSGIINYQFT